MDNPIELVLTRTEDSIGVIYTSPTGKTIIRKCGGDMIVRPLADFIRFVNQAEADIREARERGLID